MHSISPVTHMKNCLGRNNLFYMYNSHRRASNFKDAIRNYYNKRYNMQQSEGKASLFTNEYAVSVEYRKEVMHSMHTPSFDEAKAKIT